MGDIELLENEEILRGIRFPHKIERVSHQKHIASH